MRLATDDLQAKKAQDVRDLRFKLQDLLMQLTAAQSLCAEEERALRADSESLMTELERIKADADIAFTQYQTDHLARKEQLQRAQNEEFRTLSGRVPQFLVEQGEIEADSPEFRQLKQLESQLRNSRSDITFAESEEFEGENPYPARILELERAKRELMQSIREDAHNSLDRIMQLGMHLDNEEAEFKAEAGQLNANIKRQDETYKKRLERLYTQLETIQSRRVKVTEATEAKVRQWEEKIEAIDGSFRARLAEANRVAETLKSSLMTANIKKSQHLEIEKQRARDEQKLLQESMMLQQELFDMHKQVERAKEESGLLQRELSAKIGMRRTASLYL
jgi:hypothetical protein